MDFFGAQAQARRRTRRLVLLFLLAVVGVIFSVYLAVGLIFVAGGEVAPATLWNPELFLSVAAVTALLISGGSFYKIAALASGGGVAVAESLGGRLVSRSTTEPLEKRLLNVVDEMALASGVVTPKVFILDNETGINAFAAGFSPQEAVVAVTRGCLEQLSRDELQGVVAHEFSHILNGDMRLNLRLIGMLHGILLLALMGRVILNNTRSASRSKNGGGIVFFGLALLIIGYIGIFFGNLIKAAASRQREFLADASAVQFTRNPDGIGGALKKIGGFEGSKLNHPRAEEASHMLFEEGISSFFNWFATHPPIEERIRRIDASFSAEQAVGRTTSTSAPLSPQVAGLAGAASIAVTPQQVMASVGTLQAQQIDYAQRLIAAMPEAIRGDIAQPQQARAVIYALLVVGEAQPELLLKATLTNEAEELVVRAASHVSLLHQAGRESWLPILELVIPSLDEGDEANALQLLRNCKRLIAADGRITLFEYMVDSILQQRFSAKPGDKGTIHYYSLKAIHADCEVVVSLLVHLGHREPTSAEAAFAAAAHVIPTRGSWCLQPRSAITLKQFDRALNRLATLNYKQRGPLIEACTIAIAHDGRVIIEEAELLRIIATKLDCPIPPLFASAASTV